MSIKVGNDLFRKGYFKEAILEYSKIERESPLYEIVRANIERAKSKIEGFNYSLELTDKRILVSVIVPVFNAEDFLDDCILSLRNQTLKDIQLIFVDDGSTDSSLKILNKHASEDKRIVVLKQENKYAGAARNKGLDAAIGEYVIFIDSDDFVNLELLEKTYKKAKENNVDVVIFDACEFDTQTKEYKSCKFPLGKNHFPKKEIFHYLDIKEKIFQANSCIPWNKLFKKSLIDKSGVRYQEIKSSNDTVFIYSLLAEADSMTLLDEVLVYYRVNNPKSLQRSKSKSWECIFQAFVALKNRLEYIGVYESVKKSFVNKALRAFLYYMSTVDERTRMVMKCSFVNKYANILGMNDIDEDYIYLKDNYKDYKKIFEEKYVPLVYACDRNYLPHTFVSISSIIKNLKKSTNVVIYVMHDDSVSEDEISKFDQLNSKNVCVIFIRMNDEFRDVNMKISHISYVTYYRLKIHEKLSFFDKIVYIDSDTIVKSDIFDLYSNNISGFFVAGVKAIAFNNKKHQERLKIDVSNYINAGVLLLNVREILQSGVFERFSDLMKMEYSCQDQDIINVAFNGKIKVLNKNFNFMTKYIKPEDIFDERNIKIIHYADKNKPWNSKNSLLSDYFWSYAKNTPYFDELKSLIK